MNKEESGFTLIEVIASLLIISLLLTSFIPLFVNSHSYSQKNTEKLVLVNLADATVERVKATTLIEDTTKKNLDEYFINESAFPQTIFINNKTYKISYKASQNSNVPKNAKYSEKDLDLVRVVVTVTSVDGKIKALSEGYVSFAKNAQ